MNRDSSVDLIKICAILFVIAIHVNPLDSSYMQYPILNRFLFSVFVLGVPLFFVQAGFFIFKEKNILKKYISYIKTILIPTLIVAFILLWIEPWLAHRTTFIDAISHISFNQFDNFINHISNFNLIKWTGLPDPSISHLWFIEQYTKCVIFAPIVALFCSPNKTLTILRRIFIVFLVAVLLAVDINVLTERFYIVRKLPYIMKLYTYILVGYELYLNKNIFIKNKKNSVVFSSSIFIILVLLKYFILIKISSDKNYYMSWSSFVSLVQVSSIIIFIFATFDLKGKIAQAVSYVGQEVFLIYLIHTIFICKPIHYGITGNIYLFCKQFGFAGALVFYVVNILITFICSLIFVSVIKETTKYIKNRLANS